MTVKQKYNIGDSVWIYGVRRGNTKPTKGKIIKSLDLSECGYNDVTHYVIEIPTEIEPLLEIRTWHAISQDEKGPVGSFRLIGKLEPTIKFVGTLGLIADEEEYEASDPTPDEVHAAIEKSIQNSSHGPLNLKDPAPRKRQYFKKKKV